MSSITQTQIQSSLLGYAEITSGINTTSTTQVQATGLTTTVTVPTLPAGRRVRVTFYANVQVGTNVKKPTVTLWDGTVGSGTQLNQGSVVIQNLGNDQYICCFAYVTPSAGSHTYNVGWSSDSGGGVTTSMTASSVEKPFIAVEIV